jgi:hypothetical protein
MTRMLIYKVFVKKENQRASISMIKQSIACENTKMQCWMFKKGMYEYVMSLLWEFVRMIHGNGNYVAMRMCTMSQDCSGKSLSMASL